MIKSFKIKNIGFGPKYPLALIAGPCVIESKLKTFNIAKKLIELTKREIFHLYLKLLMIKQIVHL